MAFGCQQEFDIEPVGIITTDTQYVENNDFTRVKLFGEITLEIDNSLENAIEVVTDEAFQKFVLVNLRSNTLEIKRSIAASTQSPIDVKVRMATNQVYRFIAWNDSHITLDASLVSELIEVELQKNSSISGEIECDTLTALIHDNSQITLSGKADIINMNLNESSEANCPNLYVVSSNIECDTTSNYIFME